jgi:hypothetical protein
MARMGRGFNAGEVVGNAIKGAIGLLIAGAVCYFGYDWWTKSQGPREDMMWEKLEDKTFSLAPGEQKCGIIGIGQWKPGDFDTSFRYDVTVECLDGEVGLGSAGANHTPLTKDEFGPVSLKKIAKGRNETVSGRVTSAGLEKADRTYHHWVLVNQSATASASVHLVVKKRKS